MSSGSAATPEDLRALVAIDLGAESCRVSLLRWLEGRPHITLVFRFANGPVTASDGSLHWDIGAIEAGLDVGLRRCAQIATEGIRSIAVDGWAVDYARYGADREPLADPYCYRDLRTVKTEEWLHTRISAGRLREITAVQPQRINTLYQLIADKQMGLPAGDGWINLPEYILFRLGGRPVLERTNAAHGQLVDVETRDWSAEIFAVAELDLAAAPELVWPGTDVGQVRGPLAELGAYADTRLIAPATHDTASAIAGIPAIGTDWAYVSSGTWSLVGTLVDAPVRSSGAAEAGFTNLAAAGGLTCFHVNINGMWPLRQCMGQWKASGFEWSIEELIGAAQRLPAPAALIHVDEPSLLLPGAMMQRINAQLASGGQAALDEHPDNAPAFANLIFHSLAARYHEVLANVMTHTGKTLRRIFIVGGGSRNQYLNRLIEEATGLEVQCGSPESSTIGNFAIQLAVLEGEERPGAGLIHRYARMLQGTEITAAG